MPPMKRHGLNSHPMALARQPENSVKYRPILPRPANTMMTNQHQANFTVTNPQQASFMATNQQQASFMATNQQQASFMATNQQQANFMGRTVDMPPASYNINPMVTYQQPGPVYYPVARQQYSHSMNPMPLAQPPVNNFHQNGVHSVNNGTIQPFPYQVPNYARLHGGMMTSGETMRCMGSNCVTTTNMSPLTMQHHYVEPISLPSYPNTSPWLPAEDPVGRKQVATPPCDIPLHMYSSMDRVELTKDEYERCMQNLNKLGKENKKHTKKNLRSKQTKREKYQGSAIGTHVQQSREATRNNRVATTYSCVATTNSGSGNKGSGSSIDLMNNVIVIDVGSEENTNNGSDHRTRSREACIDTVHDSVHIPRTSEASIDTVLDSDCTTRTSEACIDAVNNSDRTPHTSEACIDAVNNSDRTTRTREACVDAVHGTSGTAEGVSDDTTVIDTRDAELPTGTDVDLFSLLEDVLDMDEECDMGISMTDAALDNILEDMDNNKEQNMGISMPDAALETVLKEVMNENEEFNVGIITSDSALEKALQEVMDNDEENNVGISTPEAALDSVLEDIIDKNEEVIMEMKMNLKRWER